MAVSLSDSPPSQGPLCPVCFRDYSDSEAELIPRILQCGHTYCSECLERLMNIVPEDDDVQSPIFNIRYAGREWTSTRRYPWLGGGLNPPLPNDEIKCPTCSSINHIRNRDISGLTKNFALLSCRPQKTNAKRQKTLYFCKEHDHEKRVYCDDCKMLICAYCQLYGEHKDHNYTIATEAAKPLVERLQTAGKSLTDAFRDLSLGETEVNSAVMRLERNRRKCEQKVQQYYSKIIDKLEQRKDSLMMDIGSWSDEQMYILNAQLDSLTSAMKSADKLRKMCQTLAEGDPLDALSEHDNVMNGIKDLHSHVAELSFQPLINPWMKCKTTPGRQDEMIESLLENCELSYDTNKLEDGGLHSGDDSDSNSDNSSLHNDDSGGDDGDGGNGGGERENGGFRLSLGSRRGGAACRSSDDEDDDTIQKKLHIHSQESYQDSGAQELPKLEGYSAASGSLHPGVRPTYSFLESRGGASNFSGATPNNSYQSTPTSVHSGSNSSVFMNHLPTSRKPWTTFIPRLSPATDSGSNTDDDGEPHFSSLPVSIHGMERYRIVRDGDGDLSEDSSHNDQEETLEAATEAETSHYVASSVLDSVELRQRYSALNSRMGELTAPAYGQSDTSMLNQSDMPSPQSHGEHDEEDFTFGHHLSLPVDSTHDDNELVFPVPRQFSWTTDQSDGRARAVMFEIDHNGTSVQFSIRAQDDDPEDDMDLLDSDNS